MAVKVDNEMLGYPAGAGTGQAAGWRESLRRAGLFVVLLACGLAVFFFGSNYYTIFPTNMNLTYEVVLAAAFLAAALGLRASDRMRPYWPVMYAFFVDAAVVVLTTLTIGWRDALLSRTGFSSDPNQEMAAAKVFEALVTIPTVLLLSALAGFRPGSLYVQRGNLRVGLFLGIGVLVNFAASALMFFYSRFEPQELGNILLCGLVFSLANGFMEELWIRGQFLRKLDPLLGSWTSIALAGTWFSIMHAGAYYFSPTVVLIFLANLFTFALAWGYAMKKTSSWIAPGLMHAASDLFLFLAVLAS